MSYKTLIDQKVTEAFRLLGTNGLTVEATVRYLKSQGEFDEVTETYPQVWEEKQVTAVLAKPEYADVKEGVPFTDGKLIIPGAAIPAEPNTDTDRVSFNGKDWNIRRCRGVPGQGVYIMFVNL